MRSVSALRKTRSGADQPRFDRQGGGHRFGPPGSAGHRQHRGPGLRPTGAKRLQRALRVHLLSPPAVVQPRSDCLAATLRPGNVHSAEGWEELLLPEIERQQRRGKEVVFRADAAFAKPELYEALEERKVKYTIRLPANDNLERRVAQLLKRPVGRPSYKPVVRYRSFYYQAASWKSARRVVAKVEFHFGELFPRVGFIVTNFQTSSRAAVRFYNKRFRSLLRAIVHVSVISS
jgi:hypothetical protein